jgi:hypothetical protein
MLELSEMKGVEMPVRSRLSPTPRRLTCPCTSCPDSSYAPLNTNACLNTITLIRNNSTTIALINKAVIDLELYNLEEKVILKEVTKK